MGRSQFTDQQVAFTLRQAEEGTAVEEICRQAGISIQTYWAELEVRTQKRATLARMSSAVLVHTKGFGSALVSAM